MNDAPDRRRVHHRTGRAEHAHAVHRGHAIEVVRIVGTRRETERIVGRQCCIPNDTTQHTHTRTREEQKRTAKPILENTSGQK